ncbi:MAG: hypothetical protein PWP23_1034 [Candidatus Sumerlaeota bacterium]|nr:hypothetical protein [Candidatus Sumerlaeota bacterium]
MGGGVQRIPMKPRRRLQHLMAGLGPLLAWIAAAAIMGFLLTRRNDTVTVRGVTEEQRAVIAPAVSGRLLSMGAAYLDPVAQGDVIAVLDDSAVRSELAVIRAEAVLAKANFDAEMEKLEREKSEAARSELIEFRRLALDINQAQLDVLDRQVELATTRVDLQRLMVLKGRLTDLNLLGALSLAELEEVSFEVAEAEEFLRKAERVLDESRAQLEESRDRLEDFKAAAAMAEPDEARLLAALNAEVGVIEARLRSMETTLTSLVLRSPLDGRLVATYAHAGAEVMEGLPIAEVAAVETDMLVAWLPQETTLLPREGDTAEVFVTGGQSKPMAGDVRRVAGAVLPMPLRLLRNPQVPEYGVPVQIELRDGVLPTGQTVRVTFRR